MLKRCCGYKISFSKTKIIDLASGLLNLKLRSILIRSSNMASVASKIGTHDGVFHCDEALACYMLRLLPEYASAEIVRSRDPERLAACHTVVDVGAVYDHAARRYDHHQREFTATLSTERPELGPKYNIKLSSAGLVYAHYGEAVIEQLAKRKNIELDARSLTLVYKRVYENIIEEVDAIDNGVPIADGETRYKICTHLSSRVHRLNPEWNSTQRSSNDELFEKAMLLVGEELTFNVDYFTTVWLPGRRFVVEAMERRMQVHGSGQILEFTERFPWKNHLFDLENEMGVSDVKYVVFADKPNSWRVQAVPTNPDSFTLRKPLNPAWWGVRDHLLSQTAGIDGCIFCHGNGFIGGNATRDGAVRMAVVSLEADA